MDALEAVGDPELRETLLFARDHERPVTADEVAAGLDVHRNVARSRLERLTAAGLLESGYERRTGRTGPGAGRPAKTYAVVPSAEAIEFPARRYEELLGLLVESLPARGRSARLREVGIEFGDLLASAARLRPSAKPAHAFEAMCAAVRRLGYQAAVEEADEHGAVLTTPTCPLRPLVQGHPEAAEIDRGMWIGLATRALRSAEVTEVTCETRDCLVDHTSCRVLVSLRSKY